MMFFNCNLQIYDLHIGRVGSHNQSADGCEREEAVCGHFDDPKTLTCGINGTCIGSFHTTELALCVCRPGWRGTKCSKR